MSLFSKLDLSEKRKKYTIRTQHRVQRKKTPLPSLNLFSKM
jgi:hypothetical protein